MSIRTEPGSGGDPHCPHCDKPFYVTGWGTEHNDPVIGVSETTCPRCRKPIEIEVSVHITAHPKGGNTWSQPARRSLLSS